MENREFRMENEETLSRRIAKSVILFLSSSQIHTLRSATSGR